MSHLAKQSRHTRTELRCALSDGGLDPSPDPFLYFSFADFTARDTEHDSDGVIRCRCNGVAVQREEHSERLPCQSLVAVDQRMVRSDTHGENGGLLLDGRIEVFASETRLRCVQRRVEKLKSRCFAKRCDIDAGDRFRDG